MKEDYFNPDFLHVKMHGGLWRFPDGTMTEYKPMTISRMKNFCKDLCRIAQEENRPIFIKAQTSTFNEEHVNYNIMLRPRPFEPTYNNRLNAVE